MTHWESLLGISKSTRIGIIGKTKRRTSVGLMRKANEKIVNKRKEKIEHK